MLYFVLGLMVGLIVAPCLLYGGARWLVKYFDDIDKRRFPERPPTR